jgi:hypothetical protein
MIEVLSDPALRTRMIANASAYSDEHSWKRRKADYLKIVDDLIAPGREPGELLPLPAANRVTGTPPRSAQSA